MKYYTLPAVAETLGVDVEALQERMTAIQLQPELDAAQQPVLDEEQVKQLAQQATVSLSHPSGPAGVRTAPAPAPAGPPIILGAPMLSLGRLPDNQIVLKHPQVSGHHARLELVHGSTYRIVDLHSTNHTYVNGLRVKKQMLNVGDQINIGPYALLFTGSELIQQSESEGIRIDALRLKQFGKWHSLLLHDISLPIAPHQFVALVGGSGVGKTTLLNALSGIHPAPRGTVLYNGQDYYRHLDDFSTQIGYVPQDDITHGRLRVADALYYTAKLRLPDDFKRSQIKERVNEVLANVGLTHRRRHMVRSLSGGERKRVSIALELLANPRVLFLDEPSAGVDPGLDQRMMQLLRKLANEGHTIVLVTHATENIDACDKVCFLAQGGYLAFYGSPQEAKEYFNAPKFSDIYSQLEPTPENKGIAQEAEKRFKASPYYQQHVAEPLKEHLKEEPKEENEQLVRIRRRRKDDRWKQFSILSRRYFRLLANDTGNLLILLLQAPVIGVILYLLAGQGTFTATSIATCPVRQNPVNNTGPIVSLSCQKVIDLLNTPQGIAFAQQQGQTKLQILQSAILPNSGANAQTLIFIMAFTAVLFGCINGAREIVKEAPIYRRERIANLGIFPYMFSKIIILGIFSLVQSAIVVYAVNLKTPFQQGIFLPAIVEVAITMALSALAGMMMGLLISALAPNTDRAMSLVPLVLIPQVIFSGAIFKLDTPILQAIGDLCAVRWAMAGMGSSVGLHGDKLGVDSFA
ncbi:MAG TPA: ATP-binding cassette domain-containing protein, partial [Ktedonobacteraceae bacterium]